MFTIIGQIYFNWFLHEFWRFMLVQKEIAKAAPESIEFLPTQKGATFNLEALRLNWQKKWLNPKRNRQENK